MAAAVSNYRYFPLKQAGASAARPLPDWIQANHDPQTKAVLGFNLRPAELPGGKAFARCTQLAESAALAKLAGACALCDAMMLLALTHHLPFPAAFDVVGTTEQLQDWLLAVARRSGWTPPTQPANAAGQPTDDPRVAAAALNAQSYEGDGERWRRDRLEPALLQAVERNTECDASLYAAAQAFFAKEHAQSVDGDAETGESQRRVFE